MKQVLIVDDHPLFRDALDSALSSMVSEDVGTHHCANIQEAETALNESTFDLVLLDLNMSDSSGFEGLNRLLPLLEGKPLAVVSATESVDAYQKAKMMGASGYIPKSQSLEELGAALQSLLNGETVFPDMSGAEVSDMAEKLASLTPAQRKVLARLADGLLNKQIAYEMGISEATVKAHMTAIFRKLGANNRTQALLLYKEAAAIKKS